MLSFNQPGRTPLLFPLTALALSACTSIEVASSNLDALHGERGRHRYKAELTTPWRRTLAAWTGRISEGEDAWIAGSSSTRVKNPAGRVLKELLRLASFENDRPSTQASQVRAYAWLAALDPSLLVRERAFLELAKHVERFDLPLPPRAMDPENAVDPAEFLELVRGLYEVVPPVLDGSPSATELADYEAALALLQERSYDIEGGRRLLKALAILLDGERSQREVLQPLLALSNRVQRDVSEQALYLGLRDREPRVRAAAFRAAFAAYGDGFLAEAMLALDAVDPGPPAAGLDRFGLPTQNAEDEPVFVTIYELVREHGLPSGDPYDENLNEGRVGLRRLSFQLALLRVGLNYTRYGDRSRTSAVLTLQAVAENGPATLRAEEWQDWWSGWAEEEGNRLRELARSLEGAPPLQEATPNPGEPAGSEEPRG